jgi:hypothetical protein
MSFVRGHGPRGDWAKLRLSLPLKLSTFGAKETTFYDDCDTCLHYYYYLLTTKSLLRLLN